MSGFTARCLTSWRDVPQGWQPLMQNGQATPFQSDTFLAAWYATLGQRPGVTPAIVEVTQAADGALALLLPMAITRQGGVRELTFADAGVADNTGPVLGPACPADAAGFAALWRAAAKVLPPADIFTMEKQPATIGGRANPMLMLARPRPSPLNARPLEMPDTFEAYSRSRLKKFRKEQERVWRVFLREPGTSFTLVKDVAQGLGIYRDMEKQQSERMSEIGAAYLLNDPVYSAFYRRLIEDGLASGAVSLGALTANGETIGALLGVSDGRTTAFVRISKAEGDWNTSSPGRLVIERTMMALHETGVRRFDFSIGDYHYKDGFNLGSEPLFDLALPLSWRGWPAAMARRTRAALRNSPLARRIKDSFARPQSLARST